MSYREAKQLIDFGNIFKHTSYVIADVRVLSERINQYAEGNVGSKQIILIDLSISGDFFDSLDNDAVDDVRRGLSIMLGGHVRVHTGQAVLMALSNTVRSEGKEMARKQIKFLSTKVKMAAMGEYFNNLISELYDDPSECPLTHMDKEIIIETARVHIL